MSLTDQSYATRPRGVRSLLQRVERTADVEDLAITFESAVRHLRAVGVMDHLTILEAVQAAVDEAERRTQRTFRKTVTDTIYYLGWSYELRIPHPPLQSITSVEYYDVNNTLQTLSSSNYSVSASSNGQGSILFDRDYTFPNLYEDRLDKVKVVAVTGYGTDADIPGTAKTAIRLLSEANYDGAADKRSEAFRVLQPLVFRGSI